MCVYVGVCSVIEMVHIQVQDAFQDQEQVVLRNHFVRYLLIITRMELK